MATFSLKYNGAIAYLSWVDMLNIPKDLVAGPFYYTEQNDCLKILTLCVWKINWLERKAALSLISSYS
jgi:hypothetical protein